MQLHETPEGHELVQNISKAVVADLAPEELEFFDELAAAEGEISQPSSGDEELGFGISEAVVAVTPIAVSVVTTVVMFVGNEILKGAAKEVASSIGKEAGTAIVARIKSYFSGSADAAKTAAQAKQIAAQTAQNKGLSKEESDRLAASVMAYLGA
jgi:hypothetical protein